MMNYAHDHKFCGSARSQSYFRNGLPCISNLSRVCFRITLNIKSLFSGLPCERARLPEKLMEELRQKPSPPSMKLFDDPDEERMVWEVRENGLGATAHVPGEKENFS